MTIDQVKERTQELLQQFADPPGGAKALQLFSGTLSLMIAFYGSNSTQVKTFVRNGEQIREKIPGGFQADYISELAWGPLQNLAAELEAGFIGTLQKTITGEVLTDH